MEIFQKGQKRHGPTCHTFPLRHVVGSDVESELWIVEEADGEKRGRDGAAYFTVYRMMGKFGGRWAKSEYGWMKERLTDYNLRWANGYSERMSHFWRHPDLRADEIRIFLDESCV